VCAPAPTINVSKSANPTSLQEPGGDVTFTVRVQNTGAQQVTLVSLEDSVYGNLHGQGQCTLPQNLGIGETYVCTFTGNVSGNAGDSVTDIVTAIVRDAGNNEAQAQATATVTIIDTQPSITVAKSVVPTSVLEPGANVAFTAHITNTGAETVTLFSLTDSVYGNLHGRGNCFVPQDLGVGDGAYVCTFNGDVSGVAGDVVTNIVTAFARDDEGNQVQAQDGAKVAIIGAQPAITVTKTADPASLPEPGGDVTFTVRVENIGAQPVTLTALADEPYGDLNGQGTCSVPQSLGVDEEAYECTFTVNVSGNDGDAVTDTVTATAEDDGGNELQTQASATVTIAALPLIAVTKTANPTSLEAPGGDVAFTVRVENIGTRPITLTALVDEPYGDLSGQDDCLVPQNLSAGGGAYECTFTANVSGSNGEVVTDTVTATARDDEGNEVQAQGDASVSITAGPPPPPPTPITPIPGCVPLLILKESPRYGGDDSLYTPLVDRLIQEGYQQDTTLFFVEYDWKGSIGGAAAQNLDREIARLKTQVPAEKFAIVAHGQGGLVARAYISETLDQDVDQLTTVGTPYSGIGKTFLTWPYGALFSNPSQDDMLPIWPDALVDTSGNDLLANTRNDLWLSKLDSAGNPLQAESLSIYGTGVNTIRSVQYYCGLGSYPGCMFLPVQYWDGDGLVPASSKEHAHATSYASSQSHVEMMHSPGVIEKIVSKLTADSSRGPRQCYTYQLDIEPTPGTQLTLNEGVCPLTVSYEMILKDAQGEPVEGLAEGEELVINLQWASVQETFTVTVMPDGIYSNDISGIQDAGRLYIKAQVKKGANVLAAASTYVDIVLGPPPTWYDRCGQPHSMVWDAPSCAWKKPWLAWLINITCWPDENQGVNALQTPAQPANQPTTRLTHPPSPCLTTALPTLCLTSWPDKTSRPRASVPTFRPRW
jgi:putative lipoic acid-binding regulatory protein